MSRFDKIAAKLNEYELDAMLLTSDPNRLYAAGFPSSDGTILITKEQSYFFADSRYIEAAQRAVTGAEVRLTTREKSAYKQIEELVAERGVKRIGFEETYATVAEWKKWKEKLPSCKFVPAANLITGLRIVKDAGEIASMTAAQRIAEKALTEVLDYIQVGRTEQEVAAYLQYKMLCFGAEKMSFEPIVVSGANSSLPHGVPTEKPIAAGDFLTMDFGCVKNGYCSDMTRTVAVGYVTEEMEKVYHTVLTAQNAGIQAAKAGVMGKTIHEAGANVIGNAGYGAYFGHGFGHSVGVEIHEDPRAGAGREEIFPAGSVVTAEPGIYIPGKFGVRIEDMILIEENGCRNLTEAPKELLTL